MAEKADNKLEKSAVEGLANIPQDLLKEIIEEDRKFADGVLDYELPDVLEDKAQPLTMKEKKKLKKFKLTNIDSEENLDDFIYELAKMREIEEEIIDEQQYSSLGIWIRKVCYSTFNLKKAVKK